MNSLLTKNKNHPHIIYIIIDCILYVERNKERRGPRKRGLGCYEEPGVSKYI